MAAERQTLLNISSHVKFTFTDKGIGYPKYAFVTFLQNTNEGFKQQWTWHWIKMVTRDAPILNFSADTDSRLFRMISADTDCWPIHRRISIGNTFQNIIFQFCKINKVTALERQNKWWLNFHFRLVHKLDIQAGTLARLPVTPVTHQMNVLYWCLTLWQLEVW